MWLFRLFPSPRRTGAPRAEVDLGLFSGQRLHPPDPLRVGRFQLSYESLDRVIAAFIAPFADQILINPLRRKPPDPATEESAAGKACIDFADQISAVKSRGAEWLVLPLHSRRSKWLVLEFSRGAELSVLVSTPAILRWSPRPNGYSGLLFLDESPAHGQSGSLSNLDCKALK